MEISIIGASGYTGIELMRILANHRNVDSVKPYSRTYAGKKAGVVNKSLVKFDKFQNFHDFDGEKTIDNWTAMFVFYARQTEKQCVLQEH